MDFLFVDYDDLYVVVTVFNFSAAFLMLCRVVSNYSFFLRFVNKMKFFRISFHLVFWSFFAFYLDFQYFN